MKSRLCRTHEENRNTVDPEGCIACQSYTRGYMEAQKHFNDDIERKDKRIDELTRQMDYLRSKAREVVGSADVFLTEKDSG